LYAIVVNYALFSLLLVRGKRTVNVLPRPSVLVAVMVPPWRRTISRTTYSPTPKPLVCMGSTFGARHATCHPNRGIARRYLA
jgi:hypothetical protein